ncbi:MAG: TetR/AcrR family transcriptional regulator [Bacteroidales bacterium]|nr:TetR/AcrR family transcriptional regulator [Bacteroidales bacterium]
MNEQLSSRQMEILIFTVKLIENGGISNVTIKNLAKQTNVTEGAIYKHFSGKNEILIKTMEMVRADVMDVFFKANESADQPMQILKNIFIRQAAFFEKNPAYVIIILSEALYKELGFLSETIRLIMSDSRSIIKEIIKKGQRKLQIRSDIESGQLTFVFMSALRNCINQWYLSDFETDIRSKCDLTWKTIFQLIKM